MCLQVSPLLGSSFLSWGCPLLQRGLESPCPAQRHGTHLLPSCLPSPAQSPSFCLSAQRLGWGTEEGDSPDGLWVQLPGLPCPPVSLWPQQVTCLVRPNHPSSLPALPKGPAASATSSQFLPTKSRGRYPGPPGGQLRIIHVSPEDAGNYFCLAQNSAGSAVGKTRLVVQGGPGGVTKVDPSELRALRLLRAPPVSAWLWSQVGHVPASMPIPAWLVVLEGIQGTHLLFSRPRSGFRQKLRSSLLPLTSHGKRVWLLFVHVCFAVATVISVVLVPVCACV